MHVPTKIQPCCFTGMWISPPHDDMSVSRHMDGMCIIQGWNLIKWFSNSWFAFHLKIKGYRNVVEQTQCCWQQLIITWILTIDIWSADIYHACGVGTSEMRGVFFREQIISLNLRRRSKLGVTLPLVDPSHQVIVTFGNKSWQVT